MRPLPLLVVLAVLSCRSEAPPVEEEPPPDPVPTERFTPTSLPEDWRTRGAWGFERWLSGLDGSVAWDGEALAELAGALEAMDLGSVRAAVLLGRGGKAAHEALLSRLEERVEGPERESDAGDVVAAAALAGSPTEDTAERLSTLAVGPSPHPDLEVRTECAAGALDLGRDEVVPFLLRVLRAGTPAELTDPIDWRPTETTAWAKTRAAEALSRRTGRANTFQPDGSFEAQISYVDDLAERLGIER